MTTQAVPGRPLRPRRQPHRGVASTRIATHRGGVVAIVGWFGWYTLVNPANGGQCGRHRVRDPGRSASVSAHASRSPLPAGTSVACAIEAQDEEHGVVGWKVVEIPASDTHLRAFSRGRPHRRGGDDGFGEPTAGST